ncbi:MAG: 50S ribosomal protein L19 [bacterium]
MQQVISPVNVKDRAGLGIRPGDTVRVMQNIIEIKKAKGADKKEKTTKSTRQQAFEGLVLAVKHGTEAGASFTVRAVLSGIGVEKIFPLYSPNIEKIEIKRRSKVRRAKLYFIREKVAREVKRQLRNARMMNVSTSSEPEESPVAEVAETPVEAPAEAVAEEKVEAAS